MKKQAWFIGCVVTLALTGFSAGLAACSDDESTVQPPTTTGDSGTTNDTGTTPPEPPKEAGGGGGPDGGVTCNDDPASTASCESCCGIFADGLQKPPCAAPSRSEELFLGVIGCACSPACSVVCNDSCTTQAFPNAECLQCIKTSCVPEFSACTADTGKPAPVSDAGDDAGDGG